ncbi:MAG: Flp pilus assembly protein CpaB [Alphaproteobacteria bacterium]|nr:MAG: Flp pilus assembly protein CpaB [Alphaproteobacteria bacterium]
MAGLAVVFGATSYVAGNRWLESQAQARLSEIESTRRDQPAIELSTVVVAADRLRFGEKLTEEKLREVAWPADARPDGAYATIVEVIGNGERKAIKTIEPGEPVLAVKLTGENGRAGLAGIISEGMRAVTIPVDMVNGVGGFVMPGDSVDIVLTRRDREDGEQFAKIIMENVKVLSIDQDADTRADAPKVAKTVTLETDAAGAQKLALATSLGRLSLLLRSAGDDTAVRAAELSAGDLDGKERPQPVAASADTADDGIFSFLKQEKRFATVTVVKREQTVTHSVPVAKPAAQAQETGR